VKGYVVQLEEATRNNENFRQVLFSATHSQLVLMSLKPGEEIGEEVHDLDQFIRFEAVKDQSSWMASPFLWEMA